MHLLRTYFDRLPALAGIGSILIVAGLSGCAWKTAPTADAPHNVEGVQTTQESRFLGLLSPYRIDIQQGNFVSSEVMGQLREAMKRKEGVTRDQVRFLLGTPLIADIFHADRWDYVFRLKKGNGEVLTSHVTATFKDNQLATVDGTNLPTEKDYISLIANNSPTR